VIKGRVSAKGQAGQVDIDQKHEATFDLNNDHYEVA